ncbi:MULTISPECIES: hypothetical protein [unclassified Photorhabdus]|uniref:hypothetical protein n=1 Tax=unclassified Photorhabdus TaxID=2620880 RepID=UPI0011BF19F0|nr:MULTISPECIES: hypothetical protein [unclassified Photorhabdus]
MNGQRQEPDDGRLSRPVPWERRGEVPLRDPITPSFRLRPSNISIAIISCHLVRFAHSLVGRGGIEALYFALSRIT